MDRNVELVKEFGGAREFKLLSNGLGILLFPLRMGEAVGLMVHYNVGSRNEGVGHTGSTHFLEHLEFCGSENFPADTRPIMELFAGIGADFNAGTWYDGTAYYEVMAPEHLDLCMAVEADRMRNATFTDEDRQGEMTVVRNEFEIGENRPNRVLLHAVIATAIREHPYHHPTIGWRSDVEGVDTARFREFYDTFYYPNNAMVIVVGNFDEEQVLRMINSRFEHIESSPNPIPQVYTVEPPQQGERRIIVKRPGGTGIVSLSWVVPGFSHPDFAPLEILDYALTGGNRSLLKSRFVTSGRVRDVSLMHYPSKDPFSFYLGIDLLGKGDHAEIESEVREFLESLQKEGVTEEQVGRAGRLALADSWYERDGLSNIMHTLSVIESAGSWDLYFKVTEALQDVDRDDVMRVFEQYLHPDNLTVGWYVPEQAKKTTQEAKPGGDS